MHSGGFELTNLTYTMLEDNLKRHRGDRLHVCLRYCCIAVCCIQYHSGNIWYYDEIQKNSFLLIRSFHPTKSVYPLFVLILHPREIHIINYVVTDCCETVSVHHVFIVSVHAFVSKSCVQPSQPSPSQPRPSRPRCRGVCLPTRCPASPLPTLHLLRSPLWRCCSFAWQARKTKEEKITGERRHDPTTETK